MIADEHYKERQARNYYGPDHAPGMSLIYQAEDWNEDKNRQRNPPQRLDPPLRLRFRSQERLADNWQSLSRRRRRSR